MQPAHAGDKSHNLWSRSTADPALYQGNLVAQPLGKPFALSHCSRASTVPDAQHINTLHCLSHVASTSAAVCLQTTNIVRTCPKTGRPWQFQQHTACLAAMRHTVAASLQHPARQRATRHAGTCSVPDPATAPRWDHEVKPQELKQPRFVPQHNTHELACSTRASAPPAPSEVASA